MNLKLKLLIANAATWVTWQLYFKKIKIGNCVPILCYHQVLPPDVMDFCSHYTVDLHNFEAQMAYLNDSGFISLSLYEYADLARGKAPMPERGVLITFDDGYIDNYSIAWPIARKYNIKINLFICTGIVGQAKPVIMTGNGYKIKEYSALPMENANFINSHISRIAPLCRIVSWQEISEMAASGVGIGLHGHSHLNFALSTPQQIAMDIATSLTLFQQNMGYRPKFFALPYGGYGTYSSANLPILKQFDFDIIFANHFGRSLLPSDELFFNRMSVHKEDNLTTFERKLYGGYDWLAHVRRIGYLARLFMK